MLNTLKLRPHRRSSDRLQCDECRRLYVRVSESRLLLRLLTCELQRPRC